MRKDRSNHPERRLVATHFDWATYVALSAAASDAGQSRATWLRRAAEEKLAREAKARKEAEHDAA